MGHKLGRLSTRCPKLCPAAWMLFTFPTAPTMQPGWLWHVQGSEGQSQCLNNELRVRETGQQPDPRRAAPAAALLPHQLLFFYWSHKLRVGAVALARSPLPPHRGCPCDELRGASAAARALLQSPNTSEVAQLLPYTHSRALSLLFPLSPRCHLSRVHPMGLFGFMAF